MKEMIDSLYEQVTSMNAGEGHIQMDGIKKDTKATLVVSVYHGQRPAHKVLEELYSWAKGHGFQHVMDKIHEFEEME
jgi:hypothetical protein